MARGRAPGYDDQRETIVARAAELFARQGYHATSMNQVAEAAGLSKATLYHYYKDKDALLVHIADGHVSRLQALVASARALGLKPEAQFRELVRRIVEEYADAQHAHRVLTEDVKFLAADDRRRILDAASAAGMEVPFSCTSGVCGTCRAKLVEGQVRMERNFALDKAEVAGGFVLTCQAHPLTERVVLSFDDR